MTTPEWTACGNDPTRKHVWTAWTVMDDELRPVAPFRPVIVRFEVRTCVLCGVTESLR